MNKRGVPRIIAMLVGGAVLFGLEQGLGLQIYVALPAAVLAYVVTLFGMGLMLGADTPAK